MLIDALTLQLGYNATLVALGAAMLGLAAGTVGTFLYLRKRALVADAISHATLPGVALAFIVMVALGGTGRNLIGLMTGSALSAAAGVWVVTWLTRNTRLPQDAAIGAVLSVFFGAGITLLTVIQTMDSGQQAGLESILLGATAGMLRSDAQVIATGAALTLLAAITLRRPLWLISFDEGYAAQRGLNVARYDLALLALVLAITVTGLKITGLILIVAMLIMPPAAARFWTDRADRMTAVAAAFGGLSGYTGAALSAAAPDLPTGPIIVLCAFALFLLSMTFGPARGAIATAIRRRSRSTP